MQERTQMRSQCEKFGLHWAKGTLPNFGTHPSAVHLVEWISEKEAEIAAELEAKQLALAMRNTEAAEQSAAAAIESARTSGTSARAAIFAAFVSFFALVVAVAAYFKQS